MHLVCLTPTYGRPTLVRNALSLFLRQQLRPGDTAHMLVFADDGLLREQIGVANALTWQVMTSETWIPLTRKYAPMLDVAGITGHVDAWVVWDDDDVYLSWHLAAHAEALQVGAWSHPSQAYSTYGINPLTEPPREKRLGGGHYHGALAVRADLMRELGGWPATDRSDYDKQMMASCRSTAGPPADPCMFRPPSYVYRWADTGRDHVSGRSRVGADGVRRYRPPRSQESAIDQLTPKFDSATMSVLCHLGDF